MGKMPGVLLVIRSVDHRIFFMPCKPEFLFFFECEIGVHV